MIQRIDTFLRPTRNYVVFLISCLIIASLYALVCGSAATRASELAATKARQHAAALQMAKKRARWSAHLRRLAWNRAHPEIVAQQKAAARARAEAQARQQAAEAEQRREQAVREAAQQRAEQERQNKLAHACDTASDYERQAVKDIDAGSYQDAYDNAASGLDYNDSCENYTRQVINKGYLLSMKGLAEHNLSTGDSRTDLNQANQLLVECQTTPGVYGTSIAAGCETQEENNIKAQTNWDIQSYDNGN